MRGWVYNGTVIKQKFLLRSLHRYQIVSFPKPRDNILIPTSQNTLFFKNIKLRVYLAIVSIFFLSAGYKKNLVTFWQHFLVLVRRFSGSRFLKYCLKLCVWQKKFKYLNINKLADLTLSWHLDFNSFMVKIPWPVVIVPDDTGVDDGVGLVREDVQGHLRNRA